MVLFRHFIKLTFKGFWNINLNDMYFWFSYVLMSPGKKQCYCYDTSILLLSFAHLWGITNKTSISYCLVPKFYPCLSFSQIVHNVPHRKIIPTGRSQESRCELDVSICLLFIIYISYWLYSIIFYKPIQQYRPVLLLSLHLHLYFIYVMFLHRFECKHWNASQF